MRPSEALWVKEYLSRQAAEAINPVLELGSATLHFRTIDQPHIDRDIHAPLRERNVRIVCSDLRAGPGVDVSGNIYDPDVRNQLKSVKPSCVLCCNIFEHVLDRQEFANICDDLLVDGGLLIVTVPYSYPYHLDPIDTMFRPDVQTVCTLFPHYAFVEGAIVTDSTYWDDLLRQHGGAGLPGFLVKTLVKTLLMRGTSDQRRARSHRFAWLFRPYKITCVVLKKAAT